ncbi:MAG: hypothetical protein JNL67_19940 [Planctomycetaceae bacterium]|nr:hypothetical protein [Planctomycetaceae bacterium]
MQKLAVFLFVFAVLGLPFSAGDVFPSTTAARFRDPLATCYQFRVFDPNGRELAPQWFSLQRNYAGIPVGEAAGRFPPESLNKLGLYAQEGAETSQVPTPEAVQMWVAERLAAAWEKAGSDGPAWPYVKVEVTVYRAVGKAVGSDTWQVVVFNPAGEP